MSLMRIGKIFSALLILSLFASVASAFLYEVTPLNNTITIDEAATFKVVVDNTLNTEDYFTISTRDVNWILSSEPASGAVGPMLKAEFIVKLQPKPGLIPGNVYIVPVKIKSENTETYREEGKKFAVLIGDGSLKEYAATITPVIYMDKVVDPREPVSVRVNLRNRNPKELDNINVVLKGGSEFERSYSTTLRPLEEKVNEVLFRIDPYTLPGKRMLTVSIMIGTDTAAESTAEYEILGYVDVQEKTSKKSSWFRTESTYELYNNGNERGMAEHTFSMNFVERMFTSFEPEAASERGQDGGVQYVVRKEIGSRETFTVTTVTDYRLLVLLIVLVIISIIVYFKFRSPIIVYKSAETIGKPTQEGISEVKVRLYLKNRSARQVGNIRVTDVVPTIADLKKSAHVGSMDPINVSSGKKGTIARWEFASLEPYEERVISYKIESKLKLIGGIRLPSAKARFETKKGSERVTYSNHVNLIHRFEEHERKK